MRRVLTGERPLSSPIISGVNVRRWRLNSMLTRRALAARAGVPLEHVILMERNLPLPLDSKRRILRELWAKK